MLNYYICCTYYLINFIQNCVADVCSYHSFFHNREIHDGNDSVLLLYPNTNNSVWHGWHSVTESFIGKILINEWINICNEWMNEWTHKASDPRTPATTSERRGNIILLLSYSSRNRTEINLSNYSGLTNLESGSSHNYTHSPRDYQCHHPTCGPPSCLLCTYEINLWTNA